MKAPHWGAKTKKCKAWSKSSHASNLTYMLNLFFDKNNIRYFVYFQYPIMVFWEGRGGAFFWKGPTKKPARAPCGSWPPPPPAQSSTRQPKNGYKKGGGGKPNTWKRGRGTLFVVVLVIFLLSKLGFFFVPQIFFKYLFF